MEEKIIEVGKIGEFHTCMAGGKLTLELLAAHNPLGLNAGITLVIETDALIDFLVGEVSKKYPISTPFDIAAGAVLKTALKSL